MQTLKNGQRIVSIPELSKREARRLFLASQGLFSNNAFGRGKPAVQRAINQLSYVQIDTISVVERAHHHILWTRVKDYEPVMLDSLQRNERSIFEYWFHAAAYLPIRDYRYYLPLMESYARRHQRDLKIATEVLARIRAEGPLKARDFDDPGHKSSGWWNWKPAKQAMEHLFRSGELMVVCREGFQKVYDLRDRVLPAGTSTRLPNLQEWLRFQVLLMIDNLGLATEREIIYQRSRLIGKPLMPHISTAIAELLEEGEITAVKVDNISYFTKPTILERLPQRLGRRQIHLLSPFDNLVIQRQRTLSLFDFDYQLECYLPAAKRIHGYFALPILWGDQLVGRLDAKVERKSGILHIHQAHLESAFVSNEQLSSALRTYLPIFALHNGCKLIRIQRKLPGALAGISDTPGLANTRF